LTSNREDQLALTL